MMRSTVLAAAFLLLTGSAGFAEDVPVYEMTLQNHAFSPSRLSVPAGKAFRIKLSNRDDTPAEFESKSLRFEKVVAGKAEITVSVKALEAGSYGFYDEYHEDDAKGEVV